MENLLKDPIVLMCAGVLLFGFIALLWAIAKFLPKKGTPSDLYTDPLLSEAPMSEAPTDDLLMRDPLLPVRSDPVRAAPMQAALSNPNVADRLDQMAQRLAEMQNVLTKQASPVGAAGASSFGQGFSPETVDKLLKIIGNVTQQVDILQKAFNAKENATPKA